MIFSFIQNIMAGVPADMVLLTEIGAIIIIATFFAFFFRLIKQPLIPAYIITGVVIGPLLLGLVNDPDLITSLSNIGIAFLIFTAGLEIKLKKLKEVGGISIIGGVLQIAILFFLSTTVSRGMGISGDSAIYIGLIVAFSSTMVVVKILSDKKELNSLHGRIIIGILLVQDIAAIIALSVLTTDLTASSVAISLLKAAIFAFAAFIISKLINPLLKSAAKSPESLLLISISLLFLFSIGSSVAGLSLIIGAFFAGVALANSDYRTEIQGKVAPIRDFFAVIFFVALGMLLKPISPNLLYLLLVLIALVLIVKPVVTMFLVRMSGYKKSTSFFTGNSLAQTSEFSIIIIAIGLGLGHISEELFSALVLLTIVTMSLTSYLIGYERKLEGWLGWPLDILKNIHNKNEELEYLEDKHSIVLFGCHRMGSLILKEFEKNKGEVLVIDYNPEIIKHLMNKKIPCIYGDFMNEEVIDRADINECKIVVSTIPNIEDNLTLVRKVKRANKDTKVFIVAEHISEALELYKKGADYVILPAVMGGQVVSESIKNLKKEGHSLNKLKRDHINYLNSIHHILY